VSLGAGCDRWKLPAQIVLDNGEIEVSAAVDPARDRQALGHAGDRDFRLVCRKRPIPTRPIGTQPFLGRSGGACRKLHRRTVGLSASTTSRHQNDPRRSRAVDPMRFVASAEQLLLICPTQTLVSMSHAAKFKRRRSAPIETARSKPISRSAFESPGLPRWMISMSRKSMPPRLGRHVRAACSRGPREPWTCYTIFAAGQGPYLRLTGMMTVLLPHQVAKKAARIAAITLRD